MDEININPKYWGKGAWAYIFAALYTHTVDDFELIRDFLGNIYLPCADCRTNFEHHKKQSIYHNIENVNILRNFFCEIYNEHVKHDNEKIMINQLSKLDIG